MGNLALCLLLYVKKDWLQNQIVTRVKRGPGNNGCNHIGPYTTVRNHIAPCLIHRGIRLHMVVTLKRYLYEKSLFHCERAKGLFNVLYSCTVCAKTNDYTGPVEVIFLDQLLKLN